MYTEHMKRALVIPATSELNRGDQALALRTVEIAKACGFEEIALFAEGASESGGHGSSAQDTKFQYRSVTPLILSPRRGKSAEDRGFHDSLWNLIHLGLTGVSDLITMCWMLVMGPWPELCVWPLRSKIRNTFRTLVESDAVFVKGGGFIHAYRGIKWLYYLLYQLFPILLAERLGKKVIVLPNSYGPFHGMFSGKLVSRALRRCRLVTARERISAEVLRRLFGGDIRVFPDLAFGLTPRSSGWARAELIAKGVPIDMKPCIGITIRPWRFPNHPNPAEAFARYLDSIQHLLTIAQAAGFHPILFAHSLGPSRHEDDRVAIRALQDRVGNLGSGVSIVDSPGYTAFDLMSLYGQMRLMVATRFHSVIFAAVMGVPSIAVAYGGNKGMGIMAEMGLSDYVVAIDDVTPERLGEMFDRMTRELNAAREKVGAYVHRSVSELDSLVQLVKTALSAC